MTLRISFNTARNAVVICLLFLAAMNFGAKFFYFAFASFTVLLLTQRSFKLSSVSLLYLGLGIIMAVYNSDEGILSMLRCLSYAALYLLGFNMCVSSVGSSASSLSEGIQPVRKMGFTLLVAICAGSFAHYLLNAVSNIGSTIGRNTIDIWSGEIMAATGQAALACLMLGLSVAMIYMPPQKRYRYVGIACIAGMLTYNLVLAGRTMIAALFILLIIGFVYIVKIDKTHVKRFKIIMGFASAAMVVLVAFWMNIGGLQDYFFSSNLFNRFEISPEFFVSDSSRIDAKMAFIANGWQYPLGGLNMRDDYGYAHDLLLDGYDEYGIAGLVFLLAILVLGIRALSRFLKYTSYDNETKLSMLCVYCSVLLEFCVEPILAGMSWLFACYGLINGCLDGMNHAYHSLRKWSDA